MNNIETVKKMYTLFASKDHDAIRQLFDEHLCPLSRCDTIKNQQALEKVISSPT